MVFAGASFVDSLAPDLFRKHAKNMTDILFMLGQLFFALRLQQTGMCLEFIQKVMFLKNLIKPQLHLIEIKYTKPLLCL